MTRSDDNPNWLLDYGVIEGIAVPGGDLPSLEPAFDWPCNSLSASASISVGFDDSLTNQDTDKENGSRKRMRSGSSVSDSKACKEKMRRFKLNERFKELSTILEPGRRPKMDKAVIMSDAVRMITQLRDEAQKLKEDHENLQEKINELKAEKNELRNEKQKLKAQRDKLAQQVKTLSFQPGFLPHASAIPSPFMPPTQAVGGKLVPLVGYPGVSMWQFMSPAAVDTSEDHVLRPPVA